MNLFTRFPLRLTIPLFLLLFALLAEVSSMKYEQRLADAEEEGEALALVTQDMTQLQGNISDRLRKGDWEGIKSAIANSGSNPNVMVDVLVDDAGTIINSTNLRLVGTSFSQAFPDADAALLKQVGTTLTGRAALSSDGRLISASYPVILGAKSGETRRHRVGMLYQRYDLALPKAIRRHGLERHALVMAGFYAGGFLLLSLFLHLVLAWRVGRLVSATRGFAAGDFSAQSSLEGRDELAQIGGAFDQMAGEIARNGEALRRLNRELRAISNCNQTLMRATDEQALLNTICNIVCDEAGYRMAWVGYAEHDDARTIRRVAHAGVEDGYIEQAQLTWADTERGRGPVGTANRSGQSACIQDFATEPQAAPWRDSALQRGYRSCIALPLKDANANTFGTLNIYSTEPNAFSPEEIRLLGELAGDLAFGIVSIRTRAEVKRAEWQLILVNFAMNHVREAAFLIDEYAHLHYVNDNACEVMEYSRSELLGLNVSNLDPDFPLTRWPEHWRELMSRKSLMFESRHQTKGGRIFPVEITANYFEYEGRGYNLALVRDITERRQAEARLRESESYLRAVIENEPECIKIVDAQGLLRYMNPAGLAMIEADSLEQVIGQPVLNIVAPAYRDDYAKMHQRVLGGESMQMEFEVLGLKGGRRRLETHAAPMQAHGETVHLAVTRDITERKRIEAALHFSEASLKEAQHLAKIGSWDWDIATDTITWSEEYYRIYGIDPTQRPPGYEEHLKAYTPESAARLDAAVKRNSQTGEPYELDLELAHTEGPRRWVLARSETKRDAQGQITGLRGTAQDITERKQAEEAVYEAQQVYRALIENSPDIIARYDRDCRRTYVNPAYLKVAQIPEQELLAAAPRQRSPLPAASAEILQNLLRKVLDSGVAEAVDVIWPKADNIDNWFNIYAFPEFDREGRVASVMTVSRDITERKQAEQALGRANRALHTLSACNEALVHATNETELLDTVCRLIVEKGGYRMAWVGFAEHDPEKTVRPVAHYGHEEGFLEETKRSWAADTELGRGPVGTAIRTGAVQVNQNTLTDPALALWREAGLKRGYKSGTTLPLQGSTGVLGALTICASEPDAFNETEISLLQELATDLAFGIETLRVRAERDRNAYEHLHHEEILRHSLEQSIQAIADTVEARDPYTAGHERRVAELAAAIAREMGLAEERIHGIRLAASIHDLGKIQVPAEILARPGKLTKIEFQLIQVHPEAGYEILKDIEFPWPIATMVLQHHERLNGSGYPRGLKDGEILPESCILAVADVVEAMSSHRPYRAALGIDLALAEIERGRGTSYDPVVTDTCLKMFREKGYKLPE